MPNTARKDLVVRPDSKGRVTLGRLTRGVSSYAVREEKGGVLVLEPRVELPAREVWLYRNPDALTAVREGIEQAGRGEVRGAGDFTRYADLEID